jgi:hypothetical protein
MAVAKVPATCPASVVVKPPTENPNNPNCAPCVCKNGFKAGDGVCDTSPACLKICAGHGDK